MGSLFYARVCRDPYDCIWPFKKTGSSTSVPVTTWRPAHDHSEKMTDCPCVWVSRLVLPPIPGGLRKPVAKREHSKS